jgi:hypothetical protein
MHKGIILLTKADSVSTAQAKVIDFLDEYGDGKVWDWYVIGGRWSGTLNEINNKWEKEVRKKCPSQYDIGYTKDELKKFEPELQKIWEDLGGEGKNPWNRDTYNHFGSDDDILPLSQCMSVIDEWRQDTELVAKGFEKDAIKKWKDDKMMKDFMYQIANDIRRELFCFDCNIFNIETNNYEIPNNKKGWYAVMVDLHN